MAHTVVTHAKAGPPRDLRGMLAWFWFGPGLPALVLPLAIGVVQVVGTHFAGEDQKDRTALDALGYALLVAGPALLLFQRRAPGAIAFAVAGVTLVYFLLEYPYGPVILSVIMALFVAVNSGQRLAAWTAGLLVYAGHFGMRFVFFPDDRPAAMQMLVIGAWLIVVLVVSEVVRARREWTAEAERAQEQESRRRSSEERLRIARELHDVLGHHISLINVQAGVALHLKEKRPEQADKALTAIEQASREALSELRSVLNILQQPNEAAPRAPVPGLEGLDNLAAQARLAGLAVETQIEGTRRPLPGPVDHAAYRVVQEALTNVLRHAGAEHTTVRVRYKDSDIEVTVDDDGRGATSGRVDGGNGIPGMRERVVALGGELEAGPLPGRGFRVRAVLPLGDS